jgi:hypothetical protein
MAENNPQRPVDEKLDRESGVFTENDAREVGCDPGADRCAPEDNYGYDPGTRETGVPGTVDDVPLDFGQENQSPNDESLVYDEAVAEGGESADRADRREEQGTVDENELWEEQQPLMDEDDKTALRLQGFPEEDIPQILEAMADDAQEVVPDYGQGVSATGDSSTPDHGGFPEREE